MSSDSKYKLEYIWLDGYLPEPNLRSKTKIVDKAPTSVSDLAIWGFDGSSTQQAEGHSSDCVLKPVAFYPDSTRKKWLLGHVRSTSSRHDTASIQLSSDR